MKCPHCNGEIGIELNKKRIIEELKNKKQSIASLSRILNIKRSTLVYYIILLKQDGKICEKKLLNLTGRPILLSLK